ncbi:MAG: hypothetical protein H7268_10100 [Sandarakinorhabdus sp.]|nr:hypothetical protein [Sandarakinorhabdus sp.]
MRACLIAMFALASLSGGAALAAEAAAPQVYRLSPAERDAVIAQAAQQPERPALLLTPETGPAGLPPSAARDAILGNSLYGERRTDNRPHGEVGIFVGSGGQRGFFGTTAVPLGNNGSAQFSFSTGQGDRRLRGYGQPFGYGYGPGF